VATAAREVLAFQETPKQQAFMEAVFSQKYRELYYGGAIRGGKSFAVMLVLFVLCRVFPGSRWAVVRKDLPTIRRNLLPVFEKIRAGTGDFMGRVLHDTWTATAKNGSQIIFFPESLQEDPQYNRWRGLEVNGLWLEEANELAKTSYHKAKERAGSWVIPRTKQRPNPHQPLPFIFLTSNPAGNWVKSEFYLPWKTGTLKPYQFYLPATPHDNPYLTPDYLASLEELPERDYKIFVQGDWDELSGAALEELDPRVHLITPQPIPAHWLRFGAFDWGYRHPFRFGLYAANSEGLIYKVDTIGGRLMQDAEMIAYILETSAAVQFPANELSYVVAGHDCWHDVQARSNLGPTTAERFSAAGIPMIQADISRIAGLKNMREMHAWKTRGPKDKVTGKPTAAVPMFRMFDTPGNRRCFASLQNMILDDDRPEDVLKVDADQDGNGGDDDYDETRYALQSRARGQNAPAVDASDDQHPGFDLTRKERKPRRDRSLVPDHPQDDRRFTQPHNWRAPRWDGSSDEMEEG
jgi:hypothetical protein